MLVASWHTLIEHARSGVHRYIGKSRNKEINNIPVFHSPHYYYPSDGQWVAPPGAISHYLATEISFVGRADPVSLEGFVGSGADYPERYKKYLMDGKTSNTSRGLGLLLLQYPFWGGRIVSAGKYFPPSTYLGYMSWHFWNRQHARGTTRNTPACNWQG